MQQGLGFDAHLTSVVALHKPDGRVFENVRAFVSGDGVFITDVSLPIEPGDKLTRALPNGLVEGFIVDDPRFVHGVLSVQSHFQVKIHRLGSDPWPPRQQSAVVADPIPPETAPNQSADSGALAGETKNMESPRSWSEVRSGFLQGADKYPDLSTEWNATESRWSFSEAKPGEALMPADPMGEQIFKSLARRAIDLLGKSSTLPPFHVWLDLMRAGKRGFRHTLKPATFKDFPRLMDSEGPTESSGVPLGEDGGIANVFVQSADFCEDLDSQEATAGTAGVGQRDRAPSAAESRESATEESSGDASPWEVQPAEVDVRPFAGHADWGKWEDVMSKIRLRIDEDLSHSLGEFLDAIAAGQEGAVEKLFLARVDIHGYWYMFLVPVVLTANGFAKAIETTFLKELQSIAIRVKLSQVQRERLRLRTIGCVARFKARALERTRKWEAGIPVPSIPDSPTIDRPSLEDDNDEAILSPVGDQNGPHQGKEEEIGMDSPAPPAPSGAADSQVSDSVLSVLTLQPSWLAVQSQILEEMSSLPSRVEHLITDGRTAPQARADVGIEAFDIQAKGYLELVSDRPSLKAYLALLVKLKEGELAKVTPVVRRQAKPVGINEDFWESMVARGATEDVLDFLGDEIVWFEGDLTLRVQHWTAKAYRRASDLSLSTQTPTGSEPDIDSTPDSRGLIQGDNPGAQPLADRIDHSNVIPMVTAVVGTLEFLNEGFVWKVSYAGTSIRVRHKKGMEYIAHLLRLRGRSVHCLELRAIVAGARASRKLRAEDKAALSTDVGGREDILDDKARADYKERLNFLEREIENADERNDPVRAQMSREEKESIESELIKASALAGRSRQFLTERDNARTAVSNSIDRAIDAVRKPHGDLADHLERHIKKGLDFSYLGNLDWNV
jgi:hypothetical protein